MDATALAERIEGALRVNRVFGEPVTVDGVTVIPVSRVGAGGGGGSGRDTAPADTAPADTAPADTAPADTAPADTAPADTAPSGMAPDQATGPVLARPGGRTARRRGGEGAGGGLGWTGQPCGVFVLHDGQVSWRPALDVNRLVTAAAAVSIAALLTARAIVRIRARA
jgi:uncharacterized spore protein YtfJ